MVWVKMVRVRMKRNELLEWMNEWMTCLTDLADGLNMTRKREKYQMSFFLPLLFSGLGQLNTQLVEKPEDTVGRRLSVLSFVLTVFNLRCLLDIHVKLWYMQLKFQRDVKIKEELENIRLVIKWSSGHRSVLMYLWRCNWKTKIKGPRIEEQDSLIFRVGA